MSEKEIDLSEVFSAVAESYDSMSPQQIQDWTDVLTSDEHREAYLLFLTRNDATIATCFRNLERLGLTGKARDTAVILLLHKSLVVLTRKYATGIGI